MTQAELQQQFQSAVQNFQSGKLADAERTCVRMLESQPALAVVWHLLGIVRFQMNRFADSIAAFERAISLQPGAPDFHANLATALVSAGQPAKAVESARRSLAMNPNHPNAQNILGNALADLGRLDEAIVEYRKALSLQPAFAEAHNNLATVLRSQGKLSEAISECREAIRLVPKYPAAYLNLGNAYTTAGKLDEAIAAYQDAIKLLPNWAEAWHNLGGCLKSTGQLDEAVAAFEKSLALAPANAAFHSSYILTLHYHAKFDAHAIKRELDLYNTRHARPLSGQIRPHANNADPDRRLRVGFISPDFNNHPVGRFIKPIFELRDRSQFDLICYSDVIVKDETTDYLRARADEWKDIVGQSDQAVAQLIRDDKIDMLVDLTMHTSGNRLLVFARKPAPVQLCYLAYCGSTGLETMDYRLTDPFLDPPGCDESVYSEKTVRLANNYWCYQPIPDAPNPVAPPVLSQKQITFGCFNNFCKLSTLAAETFAKILKSVPGSTLQLHAQQGSHRERFISFMQSQGIASERIEFVAMQSVKKYIERYNQLDIALDPFPYNGGTTTCDALWMGVPVVTLAGVGGMARAGVSILGNIKMQELIAGDVDDYVRIAVQLSGNTDLLSELRFTLRRRMQDSPLMDAPRFVRNIESSFRDCWRDWCAQPR